MSRPFDVLFGSIEAVKNGAGGAAAGLFIQATRDLQESMRTITPRNADDREIGGRLSQGPAKNDLRDSSADDVAISHWKAAYPGSSG